MSGILPELHASGLWKLKSPYNNLLSPIWYTCIAIRKFEELIVKGVDPYKEFYLKDYSLPRSKYQEDLAAGGCIITLKSSSGAIVHFPSTYLESFPQSGGVAYQALAVAVELGAVPEKEDLTLLKRAIEEAVAEYVGVEVQAQVVNLAPKELIERATHLRLQQAREAKKKALKTTRKELLSLKEQNAVLTKKLQEAEKWIISKSKK